MNEMSVRGSEGFVPIEPRSGFLEVNGPFLYRRTGNTLQMGMTVERRHCNAGQTCHGGISMALAGLLMGMSVGLLVDPRKRFSTVSLSNDFLSPARIGDWLWGDAEVLRTTRNLGFAQSILRTAKGVVLRANGVFHFPPDVTPNFDLNEIIP